MCFWQNKIDVFLDNKNRGKPIFGLRYLNLYFWSMQEIIDNSLLEAISYHDYRSIIHLELKLASTSDSATSDPMMQYKKLNEARMDRIEKTVSIDSESMMRLQNLKKHYTWLVISEGWCGDAAQIVPVLNKMATISALIDLKIVWRDSNEALMDLFLTNGAKSIPKLVLLDQDNKAITSWGPRPEGAAKLIAEHKAAKGVVDDEAKTALQLWYLHDKGKSVVSEILDLMNV